MYHEAPEKKAYWRVKSYFKEMQKVFLFFLFFKNRNGGFQNWHDGNLSRYDAEVGDGKFICYASCLFLI